MAVVARNSGGGVELELELERTDLIPGRLVRGMLRVTPDKAREIRGALVTLIGTEHWKHEVTEVDGKGHATTRIVRRTADLPHVPIRLQGPSILGGGYRHDLPFEVPVPGLGPPSVDADVCGVTWALEAKLDVPGFDPGVALPVTIHQPTALLRAGVVTVAQFALWPSADAATDGIRASIALEPAPLDLGGPFGGHVALDVDRAVKVQEVRAEMQVHAEATVSSGRREDVTLWRTQLVGPGTLTAGRHELGSRGRSRRRPSRRRSCRTAGQVPACTS